jgi:hypothetical protein
VKTAFLIAAMLVAGAAYPQKPPPTALDSKMAYDGLEPVKVKGISLAYKRSGATLTPYKRVRIDPVEVRFHKNFSPQRTGSRLPLPAEDLEAIRTGLAKVVQEQFTKTLTAKGRYPVVNENGPDVLRLKIYIVNLYVNAPDNPGPGVSRTFVTSAGEMTLFMELYDSETGAILARVVDRQEARNANMIQMANSVTNVGEAEDIAANWARIMRDALDRAHAAMK